MMVSVVIPTYKHSRFILASLQSVFDQTFTDYEIIVINDGSPDDTAEVLRPVRESGRIRYIEQPNAGQATARNRGVREATGKYIAFLDDDDCWPADKLVWQVSELEADPQAVMVYGAYGVINEQGVLQPAKPDEERIDRPSGRVYEDFRHQCWIYSPGQTLIRTDALTKTGGLDPAIWGSDDWDLYIRLSQLGPFLYRDRVALHYRRHAGNASHGVLRHAKGHLKVVRKHIGLNPPVLFRHQRAASRYFLQRLLDQAGHDRAAGRFGPSTQCLLYALTFNPTVALRPRWLKQLAANAFRLTARQTKQ